MKHLRTDDIDLEDEEEVQREVRGANHAWRGIDKSLEHAIRTATVPKYDATYAKTFDDPSVIVSVPRQRHTTATLHLKMSLHLAPESQYPRCDWCGRLGDLLVYGRWAFHRSCWMKAQRDAPETTKLKPFTAYTIRRTRGENLRQPR